MSLSDVGIKEDCLYRLSFESGLDIELIRYFDTAKKEAYLRVSDDDLASIAFNPIIKHIVTYLNNTKKRVLLDDRINPRYSPDDVRKHLIMLLSDVHSAHKTLQLGEYVKPFCQLTSRHGPVTVNGIDQYDHIFGKITQSVSLIDPTLPRHP